MNKISHISFLVGLGSLVRGVISYLSIDKTVAVISNEAIVLAYCSGGFVIIKAGFRHLR